MMMMMPQITLKDSTNGHTTVGQNISLECNITFNRMIQLKWDFVDNNKEKKFDLWSDAVVDTEEEIKNVNDTTIYITTSHLTISPASIIHTGHYKCGISDSIVEQSTKTMWVPVYDTNESVIILDEIQFDRMNRQIKFIFLAHPKPAIQWYDNRNHIISSFHNSNYNTIFRTSSKNDQWGRVTYEATLTFKTIDFEHFGNYTVVVNNPNEKKNFSIHVNITGEPEVRMFIENLNEYNVTIKCVAVAYPEPKIQWFFKKCTDLKACLNFTDVGYVEVKGTEYEEYNLTSTSYITVSLHEIRILRCRSSNVLDRYELYVEDKDIYLQNEENVVEVVGSNVVNLICGVPNYIYTGEIAWVSPEKNSFLPWRKLKFLLFTISYWDVFVEPVENKHVICNVLHRNGSLKSQTILFKSQGDHKLSIYI